MSFSALFAALLLAGPSTTEAPAQAAEKPKNEDKVICRIDIETGSLAKRTKLCLTKREWARVREDARNNYDRMNPHIGVVQGN
ncbi:hypothetical protein [Sphingomonas sp.]|jgi:hypothetical protein|uniref:hypothetical protein n=1 Tax=Sphingomonas sp. TaxID=28214 RepID=UPI002DE754BB|nr:hypothetical protein [Sphingomonas sp.]